MATLATRGIHAPGTIAFGDMWTNGTPEEVVRHVLQWNWRTRANWTSEKWTLSLAVLHDSEIIGNGWMFAENFSSVRIFGTSSWLGLAHQGKGFGKELRSGLLDLGFNGLQARQARTNALAHNGASIGVTRSMGYKEIGTSMRKVGDDEVPSLSFRLDRQTWEQNIKTRYAVETKGFETCSEMFGVDR